MSTFSKSEVEDNVLDVVRKAFAGLQQDGCHLNPDLLKLVEQAVIKLESQTFDTEFWTDLAENLRLCPSALLKLAEDPTVKTLDLPFCAEQWTLPFGPYSVNVYSLPVKKEECILIDAGFEPNHFLERLQNCGRTPIALFITHNHRDHVGAMDTLIRLFPRLPVFAFNSSLARNTSSLQGGECIEIGDYQIKVIFTPGHSEDGLSFGFTLGNDSAIACGDTIYARSTGKIPRNYLKSIELLKTKILSYPEQTILLPGHGPITKVGAELKENPFFG